MIVHACVAAWKRGRQAAVRGRPAWQGRNVHRASQAACSKDAPQRPRVDPADALARLHMLQVRLRCTLPHSSGAAHQAPGQSSARDGAVTSGRWLPLQCSAGRMSLTYRGRQHPSGQIPGRRARRRRTCAGTRRARCRWCARASAALATRWTACTTTCSPASRWRWRSAPDALRVGAGRGDALVPPPARPHGRGAGAAHMASSGVHLAL